MAEMIFVCAKKGKDKIFLAQVGFGVFQWFNISEAGINRWHRIIGFKDDMIQKKLDEGWEIHYPETLEKFKEFMNC